MTPQRIQLSRRKGYRKPEGAVVVSRPSKWGNPFLLSDVLRRFPSLTVEQCQGFVVSEFRDLISSLPLRRRHGYPSDTEIRAELAGHDLACWCKLSDPCHADFLLKIAAGEPAGWAV